MEYQILEVYDEKGLMLPLLLMVIYEFLVDEVITDPEPVEFVAKACPTHATLNAFFLP